MPTWPIVAVNTTGMDNDTDALPRSAILDLTTKFNDVIALRGAASGVCDLDGDGVIPVARIPAAIARLADPALTGNPTAPTQALRNNSTRLATTAFVLANGLLNGTLEKTAAYTVLAADYGKLIDCTGSGGWTLAFDAAATLGVWAGAVRNSTSGTITLDPNGSELIDGAATLALAPGESCFVVCNGTALRTVGRVIAAGLGIGQTWQSVTRVSGTTYTNSTGQPIMVSVISVANNTSGAGVVLVVDGITVGSSVGAAGGIGMANNITVCAIVPDGGTYTITGSIGSTAELR